MRLAILGLGLVMAACAAPDVAEQPANDVTVTTSAPELWEFETAAPALTLASCPEGTAFERAQSITITATEIDKGPADAQAEQLKGVTFAGAWHLTADDPNFGGLSGLETLRSGSLIAISDAGAWVWIGIDPDTGTPDGIGSIGYMKGADGKFLSGKREGDAEGLAFKDGIALVSFERDHRIEAFDLEGCGVGALAAPVVSFPPRILGKKIPDNRGAEALAIDLQLFAGFEMKTNDGSPRGEVMTDGSLANVLSTEMGQAFALTGSDFNEWGSVDVYRAYDPVRGNRIKIEVRNPDFIQASALIKAPLPVDNFEGIAFGNSPSGATRIWLISDNNFNDNQRTLLFAFDLD